MNSSDSFFIVSCIAIFFFLFQWLEIFSIVVVMQCDKLSDFWIGVSREGTNPYTLSIGIFALFGLWSLADAVRAIHLRYDDRAVSVVVCCAVMICTVFIARGLWAQWEYFQVELGALDPKNSVYLNVEDGPKKLQGGRHDSWETFLKKKRCQDPFRSLNVGSAADWKALEEEFISEGGVLPWRE